MEKHIAPLDRGAAWMSHPAAQPGWICQQDLRPLGTTAVMPAVAWFLTVVCFVGVAWLSGQVIAPDASLWELLAQGQRVLLTRAWIESRFQTGAGPALAVGTAWIAQHAGEWGMRLWLIAPMVLTCSAWWGITKTRLTWQRLTYGALGCLVAWPCLHPGGGIWWACLAWLMVHRALPAQSRPWLTFCLVWLVFAVWSNVHQSAAWGVMILGAVACQAWWQKADNTRAATGFAAATGQEGLLCLAAAIGLACHLLGPAHLLRTVQSACMPSHPWSLQSWADLPAAATMLFAGSWCFALRPAGNLSRPGSSRGKSDGMDLHVGTLLTLCLPALSVLLHAGWLPFWVTILILEWDRITGSRVPEQPKRTTQPALSGREILFIEGPRFALTCCLVLSVFLFTRGQVLGSALPAPPAKYFLAALQTHELPWFKEWSAPFTVSQLAASEGQLYCPPDWAGYLEYQIPAIRLFTAAPGERAPQARDYQALSAGHAQWRQIARYHGITRWLIDKQAQAPLWQELQAAEEVRVLYEDARVGFAVLLPAAQALSHPVHVLQGMLGKGRPTRLTELTLPARPASEYKQEWPHKLRKKSGFLAALELFLSPSLRLAQQLPGGISSGPRAAFLCV